MSRFLPACAGIGLVAIALIAGRTTAFGAQQPAVDISSFSEMRWRLLGPFRGGRTSVAAGVPSQPNTFFAGTANGGVWKTTDAGRTWQPIFDREATGAVGAIAVAPSNPTIMYVGTGESPLERRAARGQGLYRSSDGGASWVPVGLLDHQHLSAVLVDPVNPDRLFVGSTGSAFGPGADRGVFRSTNGGRSFERVYFKDADTGVLDLVGDPADASVVYATLLQSRHPASAGDAVPGPGTGIVKSVDGGTNWRPADAGLPSFREDGLRRIRLAIASSNRSRLYAIVASDRRGGVYRSDDGATTWVLTHEVSPSLAAHDGSATIAVDGSNPDVVYVTGSTTLRSSDAGRTFTVWRRDPSGGAYWSIWTNPRQPGMVMLSGDRGAIVTVNGGETWSSTFNQPTGQFSDVVTDTGFPYRVCAAERDSPPGCLPSRGPGGRIAPGDWRPVSATPGRWIAPDPQDAEVVFTGAVSRFDRRTGQSQNVRPPPTADERPGPLVFSADGRTLFYGANVVWRGAGGLTWSVMSPDLSRDGGGATISSLAPSAIDGRVMWAGMDDGTVHTTRDAGVTWTRLMLPGLVPGWRISAVEASHFDTNTAYVSVVATSLDDDRPHIFRTRDAGASWQPVTAGLPSRATVQAVREDVFRRGLLFASTAQSVFVSFDDGERWQSLRLNLPPVPVTDLTVKDSDLVISTDGRGLWILDDISPFRQITNDLSRAGAFLFRPATAWRTQPMQPIDTSAHRDEPSGANPPDGVAISYLVGAGGSEPVTIEIIETLTGDLIRRFTNDSAPGFHRVIWDLKYTPVDGRTIWVSPGTYQVRLTAGSQLARQAIIVRMDPRVRASATDLTAQFKLSRAVYERHRRLAAALERPQDAGQDRERGASLRQAAADIRRVLDVLQQADVRPSAAAEAAAAAAIAGADAALGVE